MINLSYILELVYLKFFKSIPSKILMFLGLVATILSIIFKNNYQVVISQLIVYFFFSSLVNCMFYGGCKIGGCLLVLVPILGCIIIILDKFKYFGNINIKIKKILKFLLKYEVLVPNQTNNEKEDTAQKDMPRLQK